MIFKERLLHVLQMPCISEKASILMEKNNTYVFKVYKEADKREIKLAVEALFEVNVANVRTLNIKGKEKKFKQRHGRRKDWKKAYVTLLPEEKLVIGDKAE